MITFQLKLTNGNCFNVTGNQNDIFQTVAENFFMNQFNTYITIKQGMCGGEKINIQKTLFENKINNGSIVLLVIDPDQLNSIPNIPNNNPNPNPNIPMIDPNPNPSNIMMPPPIMMPNMMDPKFNPMFIPMPFPPMISPSAPNPSLTVCMNILMNVCNIPQTFFEPDANCLNDNWRVNKKNGPPGYLKEYYPPMGWYGIGLKAWGLYDNGDNTWLGTSNKTGEWYIAYHPISSIPSIIGILNNGFRKGPYQECKERDNINPLTKLNYPKCEEGVYFIPEITQTERYAKQFSYLNFKFKMAFMCRINPHAVRIAINDLGKESWIVNGDKLKDPMGRKRDEEVRACRIVMLIKSQM